MQKGFGVLQILLGIFVLAILGGGAYFIAKKPTASIQTGSESRAYSSMTLGLGQEAIGPYTDTFLLSNIGTSTVTIEIGARSLCDSAGTCMQVFALPRPSVLTIGATTTTPNGNIVELIAFTDRTANIEINPTSAPAGQAESSYFFDRGGPVPPDSLVVSSSSNPTLVPGMQKYTDADFGFSFWYPSTWKVTGEYVENQNEFPGGKVAGQLNVSDGKNILTIKKYASSLRSITDETATNEVCGNTKCDGVTYYFDVDRHEWMRYYSSSPNNPSAPNVTHNTMGGLHMFPGSGPNNPATTIVPLSAQHFLVVSGNLSGDGYKNQIPLVNTISAADPTVATPWDDVNQTEAVKMEARAYGLEKDSWYENPGWIDLQVGQTALNPFDGSDPESYESVTLNSVSADGANITFVHRAITCVLCGLQIYRATAQRLMLMLNQPDSSLGIFTLRQVGTNQDTHKPFAVTIEIGKH